MVLARLKWWNSSLVLLQQCNTSWILLCAHKATLITSRIMLKSPFLMRYNLTVELCSSALFSFFSFPICSPCSACWCSSFCCCNSCKGVAHLRGKKKKRKTNWGTVQVSSRVLQLKLQSHLCLAVTPFFPPQVIWGLWWQLDGFRQRCLYMHQTLSTDAEWERSVWFAVWGPSANCVNFIFSSSLGCSNIDSWQFCLM